MMLKQVSTIILLQFYELPHFFCLQAILSLPDAKLKFTAFILLYVKGIP
jgi:hypothetical protein